jgi:KRAB domain-containing zinc finger protein
MNSNFSTDQDCLSFEDVAVYFSWEEWTLLDDSQRLLYQTVMSEILTLMSSLGKNLPSFQSMSRLSLFFFFFF